MKKIILLLSCTTVFVACVTPPDYEDLSSEFIVATNRDQAADFTTYNTFYVSDTIVNLGGTDEDTIWHDDDATQIVARIKQNMLDRGYIYVQAHQNPDLGMIVGAVKVLNVDYYPGWYAGYPGWYPFYWWGYYPYYPWSTIYTYDTGSLIIDTYDVKNAEANNQLRALWGTVSFGALGSSTSGNITRAENSIDQAFEQSPYVKAN